MKPIIVDMKDISDSTEVYESRPNRFLVYTIYAMLLLLITAFVWLKFSNIDIVVKSNGMFRMDGNVYEVTAEMSGTVADSYVKNGTYVKAGDVLFTIKNESLLESIKSSEEQLKRINDRIKMLEEYQKCLDDNDLKLANMPDNPYYEEILNRKKLLETNIKISSESIPNQDEDDEAAEAAKRAKNVQLLTEKGNVASELLTYKNQASECETYLKNYNIQKESCSIYAASAGYFYFKQSVDAGDYIQNGANIGTIYHNDNAEYYVEAYVENADIGRLCEGQEVKLEISAYPSEEYGYFTGKITDISKDVTVEQGGEGAYYIVKVSCDYEVMTEGAQDKVNIMNGMLCQAKVIVGEKSALSYVLEKIDLLD